MLLAFFNDTATAEIYTLSLHDALPISAGKLGVSRRRTVARRVRRPRRTAGPGDPDMHLSELRPSVRERADRKSTRLNSSHANISYAVFCLKKQYASNVPPPYGSLLRAP